MDKVQRAEWKLQGQCLECGKDVLASVTSSDWEWSQPKLAKLLCKDHYGNQLSVDRIRQWIK